jgi:RNA polymerase sigma-70 factor, ECF subfamily
MQGNGHALADAMDIRPGIELDGYPTLFRDLVATFRSRGVGREESQDLAQETILRTLVHLRRHGRSADDLGPLVRTIGRNLFIERIRRAKPEVVELSDTIEDDSPEPADLVVESERRQQIYAALQSLTPRHRRVVVLWMQGLTPGQIARELGIKRNAADAILHRARRRLASVLEGDRGALAVVGLAGVRIRFVARRAIDAVGSFDSGGLLTNAATGLAAVGIAVVLSAGGAHVADDAPAVRTGPVRGVVSTTSVADGSRTPLNASGTSTTTRSTKAAKADAVAQDFGVSAEVHNPATGETEHPGAGLIYNQDSDDDPGAVERSARSSVDLACTAAATFCNDG